jgi:hypothetical protein
MRLYYLPAASSVARSSLSLDPPSKLIDRLDIVIDLA